MRVYVARLAFPMWSTHPHPFHQGGAGPQKTSCLKGPREPAGISTTATYPYVDLLEPSLGLVPASVRGRPDADRRVNRCGQGLHHPR